MIRFIAVQLVCSFREALTQAEASRGRPSLRTLEHYSARLKSYPRTLRVWRENFHWDEVYSFYSCFSLAHLIAMKKVLIEVLYQFKTAFNCLAHSSYAFGLR